MVPIHLEFEYWYFGINDIKYIRETWSTTQSEFEVHKEVVFTDIRWEDSNQVNVSSGELSS